MSGACHIWLNQVRIQVALLSFKIVHASFAYNFKPQEELLEILARDANFLPTCDIFVHRILLHGCRTGSEWIIDCIDAIQTHVIYPVYRDHAIELCRKHSPHLIDKVLNLKCKPEAFGQEMLRHIVEQK